MIQLFYIYIKGDLRMDEGGNPAYLVPILVGTIVLLAIMLIGMIIVYCRLYKK